MLSRMGWRPPVTLLIAATGIVVSTQILAQDFGGRPQRPRDTPAQTVSNEDVSNAATISGRIVDGRTGQDATRYRRTNRDDTYW